MTHKSKVRGLADTLRLRWLMLLRGTLHLWVKARALPEQLEELEIDPATPVCYVLDSYALSDLLILDKACESLGLPRPLGPLEFEGSTEPKCYLVLRRKRGLIIQRTQARSHSETLERLISHVSDAGDSSADVQLVPVTVLIGRAPDKETGFAKILFAESWEIAGRFRRLLGTLFNGRNTLLRISHPVSVREALGENLGVPRTLRKVSRILRVHFRRVRAAALGPDLSHRRTVVDQLLNSPRVRRAISDKARRENIPKAKARSLARTYAREIAADYSYTFVRIVSLMLGWFWNRIYDGVVLHHFSRFQKLAPDFEVIYVPCHRSHMDYLLVSYLIYHQGFVSPHIAAGVNLNLPVVGRLLRKGGAFYLRRTFRTQQLYSAVFHEYLSTIQAQGTSIEYFIEGTRSRTGRLLQPKGGMLTMSVRSYLRNPTRPVMFQPVYIGYERLVEGSSYIEELSGKEKKSESLGDLLNVFKVLRQQYGQVHVSFAEPIFLDDLLDKHEPAWRTSDFQEDRKPAWLSPLIDQLGGLVMTGINECAHVSGVSLIAAILLATPKHAIDRRDLVRALTLYLDLLKRCAYSELITFTDKSPEEIVEYGIEVKLLIAQEHPLGDIVEVNPGNAIRLTYFRNNISHLLALPSLVAAFFLNNVKVEETVIRRVAGAVYPFLKAELFLPWDQESFQTACFGFVKWLRKHGLLLNRQEKGYIERAEGGSTEAYLLHVLGRALVQTYERYYITITVLAKNGSGALAKGELERYCTLTAQRISQLNEFAAPEFYDRTLFRQFIELLRNTGVINLDESSHYVFGPVLENISLDSKMILSKEIRHAIVQAAPNLAEMESESPPDDHDADGTRVPVLYSADRDDG